MKLNKLVIIGLATISLVACKEDYLSVKGTDTLNSETYREMVKKNPDLLGATLAGTYSYMASSSPTSFERHDDFSLTAILHACDMMTEDIVQTKKHWFTYDYCLDFRLTNYARPYATWLTLYTVISQANGIISLIDIPATTADPASKSRPYLGQAYALRAYSYMYLLQIFQNAFTGEPDADGSKINRDLPGIPLKNTANEEGGVTDNYSRRTVGAVLDEIERNLTLSVALLDGWNRGGKYMINKNVAQGLLARYYLMVGNWDKAATTAKEARAGFATIGKNDLYKGFMDITSSDWMWGFDHTPETETRYASFFSHLSNITPGYAGLGYAPRAIDVRLYDQIPAEDYRKKWFNGKDKNPNQAQKGAQEPYANLKFGFDGSWTMDYMYMRSAEMILIEAEALARQSKFTEATTVMHELLDSRFDEWEPGTDVTIEDILLQRRIELWGEGFAYFDLKRLHRGIDRTYSGSNHRKPDGTLKVDAGDVRWTYQIPLREIQENTEISEEDNNK